MGSRSSWGSVRKLPSGSYQARFRVDEKMVAAPLTHRTKRDAEAYLSTVRADMERGQWVNPEGAKTTLKEYARKWLDQRPGLRPRTVELCESELRLHILPCWAGMSCPARSDEGPRVALRDAAGGGKPGPPTVAKCYRLLHAILNIAVADGLIVWTPCVIKGAGQEKAPERPIASIAQVFEIADAIEPRFRAMVLTAAFLGLRLGELQALTRERVDLLHGRVKVVEQYQVLKDGTKVIGPPKSDAGVRTVAMPDMLKPELEAHLAKFSAPGKKGLVFCGNEGQPLRRASWYTAWYRALAEVGIEDMKPHDLRHTGNTLAAMTGASTKELMARFGQSTSRAALIYQHATQDRDHEIADALNGMIEAKLGNRSSRSNGATSVG